LHLGWMSSLVLVSLLLYGCGGELRAVPLPKGEVTRLGNEPVILSATYPPADFVVSSWDFPPSEQRRRGLMIATTYELVDPVSRLQARVLSLLESTLGLKNVRRVESNPTGDDLPDVKKFLGDAIVLDFKTVAWYLSPPERRSPFGPYMYFVAYGARARLLNLRTLTILWQGTCRSKGSDMSPYALTGTGEPLLLANRGELLKKELEAAADRCAGDLLDQFVAPPAG